MDEDVIKSELLLCYYLQASGRKRSGRKLAASTHKVLGKKTHPRTIAATMTYSNLLYLLIVLSWTCINSQEDDYSPPQQSLTDFFSYQVDLHSGAALPCLKNAACNTTLINQADAVVLLLAASTSGSRFCTGTLLNNPKNPQDQLIVTANHCKASDDEFTIQNLWAVVFSYGNFCIKKPLSSSSSGVKPSQILQGLEIVYADELSDVLVLRLSNRIPSSLTPYFMGWDARKPDLTSASPCYKSNILASSVTNTTAFCIHHDNGDTKKLTETTHQLQWVPWKSHENNETHILAHWSRGITEVGSSGAALFDGCSALGIGVLTGGSTSNSCENNGEDMFGSFCYAWQNGMWKVLSPDGMNGTRVADGYRPEYATRQPGLIVMPSFLFLQESTRDIPAMKIRLSDPPLLPSEVLYVNVIVFQRTSMAGQAAVELASEARRSLPFQFTSQNWNESKVLRFVPGDDGIPTGPLKFQIVLKTTSSIDKAYHEIRSISGLREDKEMPVGLTLVDPVMITAGPNGIQYKGAGSLLSNATATPDAYGDPLRFPFVPGWIAFYNMTPGQTLVADVIACSKDAPLQVVMYNESRATWLSTEPFCTPVHSTPKLLPRGPLQCTSINADTTTGCAGFRNLLIPAIDMRSPYTITVHGLHGEHARYTLRVTQRTDEGELFETWSSVENPIDTGSMG